MFGRLSPLSCRFWPVLTSLVLLVVLLQILHMTLLTRLEAKEGREGKDGETRSAGTGRRHLQGRMLHSVLEEMEEKIINSHRLDRSGTYHVIDNFLTSEHVLLGRNQYEVSLVTQCSSNHLHYVKDLSARWGGPVSVAVFTYDDDFLHAASTLLHLHFCDDSILKHVSFHLAYPISRAPKHLEGLSELKLVCDYSSTQLNNVVMHKFPEIGGINEPNYANSDLAYPNNMLRNLAINYAQTPYIFLVDVDMVPSENLRTHFQKFMTLRSHTPQVGSREGHINNSSFSDLMESHLSAFVVPAFEIMDGMAIPSSKAQLLKLWLKGLIRPFYWEACNKCQKLTNYERWRGSRPKSDSSMSVAYSVQRDRFWEPFYIAKTSLPLYDGRFKQYGYNRVSQVCEMHMAGFMFHVLDSAFVVHKGFKVPGEFHGLKDAENRHNRHLYRSFLDELKAKYPHTTRSCS